MSNSGQQTTANEFLEAAWLDAIDLIKICVMEILIVCDEMLTVVCGEMLTVVCGEMLTVVCGKKKLKCGVW